MLFSGAAKPHAAFDLAQGDEPPLPVLCADDPSGGEIAGPIMPYRVNADLLGSVRHHLPEHAQDIYREAFNHAFAAHAGEADRERRAHLIGWSAVKGAYVKQGDEWVRAGQPASARD